MDQYSLNSIVGKYFVCQFPDENSFSNTEITEEEFNRISEINKSLRRIDYFKNKNLECLLNRMDYFKIVEQYSNLLKNYNENDQQFNLEYARMDINRVFNNFVISFKSMMEHSEKMIVRHYSKDSYEFKEFKEFTGHFYDTFFSYRLFIRIRNYTVHYSDPINLNLNAKEGSEVALTPHFRKTQLLRFDEIKKKISTDLALYNEEFAVEPLMKEIEEYIQLFFPMVVRIIATTEKPNIVELLYFYRKYSKDNNLSMSLGFPKSYVNNRIDMDFVSLEISNALKFEQIVTSIS